MVPSRGARAAGASVLRMDRRCPERPDIARRWIGQRLRERPSLPCRSRCSSALAAASGLPRVPPPHGRQPPSREWAKANAMTIRYIQPNKSEPERLHQALQPDLPGGGPGQSVRPPRRYTRSGALVDAQGQRSAPYESLGNLTPREYRDQRPEGSTIELCA